MIKAVIFDFYEVISTPSYMTFVQEHVPVSGRAALRTAMDGANKNEVDEAEYLALLQQHSGLEQPAIRKEALNNSAIDQEVIKIIKELKPNYQLGLLTNAIGSLFDDIVRKSPELQGLFDETVVSSEVGLVKPEPEIYRLVLEKLGVKPEEAVFVDDGPVNVTGAEAVGMKGVLFTGADQLRKDLQALKLL